MNDFELFEIQQYEEIRNIQKGKTSTRNAPGLAVRLAMAIIFSLSTMKGCSEEVGSTPYAIGMRSEPMKL